MNDDEKVCGNCRFWVTDGDEAGFGFCHRYAPRPLVVMADRRDKVEEFLHKNPKRLGIEMRAVDIEWPEINENEFCGEHEPRKEAS